MVREIEITLAGEKHTVQVNFDVVQRIEQKIDLLEYATAIERQKIKISDTAWILYSALVHKNFTLQTIGEIVMNTPADCHISALEIIYQIITPRSDKKKLEKAK